MQYFVSAENSSYFYWQLELLIESFLMQGIEKNLVIGLAENNSQKIRGFSSNLVKHQNKFVHPNEGGEEGYPPLNRIGSLRYALAYGMLKFPFALIHADMILRSPLELSEDDDNYGIILNNYEETSNEELSQVKEVVDPLVEKIAEERNVSIDEIPKIPYVSPPIIFNAPFEYISSSFFAKMQANEIKLLTDRGPKFPCERAAWEMAMAESFQHFGIRGKFMSASLLHGEENINFIHYKNGIPPVFSKKFYNFSHGTFFSGMGPYETLLEHNPSVNTNFLHQVIRSYNRRNNR